MNAAHSLPSGKIALSRMVCVLFVLSVAAPIASPAQGFNSLYSFCSQANCPDGSGPNGWLVQGFDGNFYGTTGTGGANGNGTVFKISRRGRADYPAQLQRH